MCVLVFYIIKHGLDVILGVALILNIISNILNFICEVKHGKED